MFNRKIILVAMLIVPVLLASAGSGMAQSMAADYETTLTIKMEDGSTQKYTTVDKFSRNSAGVTRLSRGDVAAIIDQRGRELTFIDYNKKTFSKETLPTQASRTANKAPQKGTTETKDLGTQEIGGFKAVGTRYVVTAPDGSTISVDNWISKDARLPIYTVVNDSKDGQTVQRYTNIVIAEQRADQFAVPATFQQVPSIDFPDIVPIMMRSCRITISPNPLNVLTIIEETGELTLGSGIMIATTYDDCVFVSDYGYFDYPLYGYPLSPLGRKKDKWYAEDTGGPIYGTGATGEIGFTADSNTRLEKTKVGMVILSRIFIIDPDPCPFCSK